MEESLNSKVGKCIDFANAILKNENKIKGKPKLHYSLRKYKDKGYYDILTYISEKVTLVISVVGYLIFDSKYKKSLVLNR